MKKFIIIVLVALSFSSCEKLKNENIIPGDEKRLSRIQEEYKAILVASDEGWYIEYSPSEDKGTVSIWMKFFDDGTVKMVSDLFEFNEETLSTFRIGGVRRPEIIFDTYSVWSVLAEEFEGSFEFFIYPKSADEVVLKNVFIETNKEFVLRKATEEDKDDVISKSNIPSLLKDFEDNSDGYFKNIILENISAFWDIDLVGQKITLMWEENGEVKSGTYSYTNLPNGIHLVEGWNPKGLKISDIILGEAASNSLKILEADEGGEGEITVSHTPAFPTAKTADYYMNTGNSEVRFYAYTLDAVEDYYSPALLPHYYDFKEATGANTFRLQVYNDSPVGSGSNSIQMRYVFPDDAGSGWMLFSQDLVKAGEDHVIITPTGTANSAGEPYLTAAMEFFSKVFPPEGVTIIPYGRAGNKQKIRIISRQDSRYYLTITVDTPAEVYVD